MVPDQAAELGGPRISRVEYEPSRTSQRFASPQSTASKTFESLWSSSATNHDMSDFQAEPGLRAETGVLTGQG
ncbi:hypothetical protein [Streptosporangium sp. NPDC001681]|uniref:hypothetical protein n=1 Tax=Streptosporangium sp. NPDC001681 TaxID=3154395 RepID=UPI00331C90F6